jgi:hypothetical protein
MQENRAVKKFLLMGLMLAVLATPAHATASGCAVVLRTPDGFLNLRAEPRVDSKIVARLKPGEILDISDANCEVRGKLSICNESGDWTKVDAVPRLDRNRTSNLHRGWVGSKFIKFVECED